MAGGVYGNFLRARRMAGWQGSMGRPSITKLREKEKELALTLLEVVS